MKDRSLTAQSSSTVTAQHFHKWRTMLNAREPPAEAVGGCPHAPTAYLGYTGGGKAVVEAGCGYGGGGLGQGGIRAGLGAGQSCS